MDYYLKAVHVETGAKLFLWENVERSRSDWCHATPSFYQSLLEARQAARRGLQKLNGQFTVSIHARPIIVREGKS